MANPVTWFEVAGPDAAALRDFYSDAFGWKINADNPMNYGMVDAGEGGIGGGVAPGQDGTAHVTFYIQVPDLREALDKVRQGGGTVVSEPMEVPDGPTLAYFTDPAGNFIGLMKA
jgi:predicted enzyme related to lactoylglutathione lyase